MGEGEISNLIQAILAKHVIIFTPDYRVVVYKTNAYTELCAELQKYQNEHTDFKWSVTVFPIGTAEFMDPDNFCTIGWEEDGKVKVFGFGLMSEMRENIFQNQNPHL